MAYRAYDPSRAMPPRSDVIYPSLLFAPDPPPSPPSDTIYPARLFPSTSDPFGSPHQDMTSRQPTRASGLDEAVELPTVGIMNQEEALPLPESIQSFWSTIDVMDSDTFPECQKAQQCAAQVKNRRFSQYKDAWSRASALKQEELDRCHDENESIWTGVVLFPMLDAVFKTGWINRELSMTRDVQWTAGRQLMDSRMDLLPDPKPTCAVGLECTRVQSSRTPSAISTWDPFSINALSLLRQRYPLSFQFSPDGKLVFPSIVFQAKHNRGEMKDAENEAAVGAARCLALLQGLRQLSGRPSELPRVLMILAVGATWRFRVAISDEHRATEVMMYTVGRDLDITVASDRLNLQVILDSIKRWLLREHREFVLAEITHIWTRHVSGQVLSDRRVGSAEPQAEQARTSQGLGNPSAGATIASAQSEETQAEGSSSSSTTTTRKRKNSEPHQDQTPAPALRRSARLLQ